MDISAEQGAYPCWKISLVEKGTPDSRVVNMLIVEDDEHTLAALMKLARRMGLVPRGARTIDEAMKEIRRSAPQVLITDWDLGEHRNGIDVAAFALEMHESCKVVFCSGNNQTQLRRQTRHLNICTYIQKPISLIALRSALTPVLAGELAE